MAARLTALAVALIVGVTLVAGLIVGAQRDDDTGPIDLLIYNARVYTGEDAMPFAEALAIRGNRIYRVGSNRSVKRLRRLATTVIDAHGGSVVPGFTDAHARLSLVEPSPARGETVAASGAAPPSGPSQLADAGARSGVVSLEEAIEGAHRLGVTGLNTIAETTSELETYLAAQREAGVSLRVVAAIRVEPPVDAATFARLDALRKAHADDPLFRADAVALRVALSPNGAKSPQRAGQPRATADPASPALPAETQHALEELDRRGWTVVLQVADGRALAAAIDGLAQVAKVGPAPAGGRRHRIEIARPMPLDLARLKALGIAVTLPLPASGEPAGVLVDTMANAYDGSPAGGVVDELHGGIRMLVAGESLADPRLGLQALTTRIAPDADPVAPSTESVDEASLAAAINAYTRTAAWAAGDDRRRGTIARNKLADIVIFSADLFTLPSDKLLDAVVTMTIFDGKVVYDRDAEAPHTEP